MSNQNNIRNGIYNTFNSTPDQQQFVRNYSSFQPNSTFYDTSNVVNSYNQNMNARSQNNLNDNFTNIQPIIRQTDFTFKNNTLDPNLNSNLLGETLRDFRINIDSNSRNFKIYPNSYNYTVFFGPITNSTYPLLDNITLKNSEDIKIYDVNKNFLMDYSEKLKHSVDPFITRNFTNVKYCRIDQLMLSKYNKVTLNKNYLNYPTDEEKDNIDFVVNDVKRICKYNFPKSRYIPDMHIENSLYMDRYILLRIPELSDGRNLSTRCLQAYTIYPDKFFCFNWLGKPYFALKEWDDSSLGNINKLTIELYNSDGKPLKIDNDDILYETKFIKNIPLLNPKVPLKQNAERDTILFYIRRMNDIIKGIVLINYCNKKVIDFYNDDNIKIYIGDYRIDSITDELEKFVDKKNSFKTIKIYNKQNDLVNINIDNFLNNVLWFNYEKNNNLNPEILHNFEILFNIYKDSIYYILEDLINEICYLPINRYYQNNISLVISCATNHLNTKIGYENGN